MTEDLLYWVCSMRLREKKYILRKDKEKMNKISLVNGAG